MSQAGAPAFAFCGVRREHASCDAIVMGGGIGALACAVALAGNGLKVEVLERIGVLDFLCATA